MRPSTQRRSPFHLVLSTLVPVVLLIVLASSPSALAVPKLVGTFSNLETNAFKVNVLNPVNAGVGNLLLSSSQFVQIFAMTPAWDATNRRFFFPAFADPNGELKVAERWAAISQQDEEELKMMKKSPPSGWEKVERDLAKLRKLKQALTESNSQGAADPPILQSIVCLQVTPDGKNATFVASWQFPLPYFFGLNYDPVTDSVVVLATNENQNLDGSSAAGAPFPIILSSLSVKTGSIRNLTQLTSPFFPAMGGIGGAPTALDVKQRQFIVSTWQIDNGEARQNYVSLINIDTLKIVNVPQNKYLPSALYLDSRKNVLYALLSPTTNNGLQANLTWGTVNTKSGLITPIYTWQDIFHVFVIGSLAALDPVAGRFYSIIGDGFSTAVGLITVDVMTGRQVYVAQWNHQFPQPQSLLVIP